MQVPQHITMLATSNYLLFLFVQDLEEDDTIIVDTGSKLYVWFGKDSDDDERKLSVKKAQVLHICFYEIFIIFVNFVFLFLQKLKQFGKHEDIISVEQGREPSEFTRLFPKWNPKFWSVSIYILLFYISY